MGYIIETSPFKYDVSNEGGMNYSITNKNRIGYTIGHTDYSPFWILADGVWNDYGIWMDTAQWNDG